MESKEIRKCWILDQTPEEVVVDTALTRAYYILTTRVALTGKVLTHKRPFRLNVFDSAIIYPGILNQLRSFCQQSDLPGM